MVDTASNTRGKNRCDECGVPVEANVGRFGYTGQAWLRELNVCHYKARAYSPALGRFLQTDPVGYEADVNLYAYTYNDPHTFADPSGKNPAVLACATPGTAPACATAAVTAAEATVTMLGTVYFGAKAPMSGNDDDSVTAPEPEATDDGDTEPLEVIIDAKKSPQVARHIKKQLRLDIRMC